jgi:hypothetical protein
LCQAVSGLIVSWEENVRRNFLPRAFCTLRRVHNYLFLLAIAPGTGMLHCPARQNI